MQCVSSTPYRAALHKLWISSLHQDSVLSFHFFTWLLVIRQAPVTNAKVPQLSHRASGLGWMGGVGVKPLGGRNNWSLKRESTKCVEFPWVTVFHYPLSPLSKEQEYLAQCIYFTYPLIYKTHLLPWALRTLHSYKQYTPHNQSCHQTKSPEINPASPRWQGNFHFASRFHPSHGPAFRINTGINPLSLPSYQLGCPTTCFLETRWQAIPGKCTAVWQPEFPEPSSPDWDSAKQVVHTWVTGAMSCSICPQDLWLSKNVLVFIDHRVWPFLCSQN